MTVAVMSIDHSSSSTSPLIIHSYKQECNKSEGNILQHHMDAIP